MSTHRSVRICVPLFSFCSMVFLNNLQISHYRHHTFLANLLSFHVNALTLLWIRLKILIITFFKKICSTRFVYFHIFHFSECFVNLLPYSYGTNSNKNTTLIGNGPLKKVRTCVNNMHLCRMYHHSGPLPYKNDPRTAKKLVSS